jgi:high-affinity iron transporter
MAGAFIQSAMILLREGLEAMLVIAALAAYLDKAGARARLPALYAGAALAIVASIVVAWLFEVFNSGAHNDIFEASVMLLAAALMLYVSGWLFVRQDPQVWQRMLKTQAEAALSQRTAFAVAALAFLAVFREGAETVLFIHALARSLGSWSLELIAGLVAAAGILVMLFFVVNVVARRLPLRPLFLITSAFLFVMALKFTGQAIQEFQEQQLISYTEFRAGRWLEAIGFNPTLEAVATQLAVIVLAVATLMVLARRGRQKNTERLAGR